MSRVKVIPNFTLPKKKEKKIFDGILFANDQVDLGCFYRGKMLLLNQLSSCGLFSVIFCVSSYKFSCNVEGIKATWYPRWLYCWILGKTKNFLVITFYILNCSNSILIRHCLVISTEGKSVKQMVDEALQHVPNSNG